VCRGAQGGAQREGAMNAHTVLTHTHMLGARRSMWGRAGRAAGGVRRLTATRGCTHMT